MRREFNITGLCVPWKHYMVDLSSRLEQMKKMVAQGRDRHCHDVWLCEA